MLSALFPDVLLQRLQKYIGLILLCAPVVLHLCAAGSPPVSTVSAYYHTAARQPFLWMLYLTAFLFFTYRAPDRLGRMVAFLAGCFVIGLALFPLIGRFQLDPADPCLWRLCHSPRSQPLHEWFGSLFGVTSLYLVLISFREAPVSSRARRRNAAYRWCGAVMVGGFVAMQLFGALGFEAQRIWPETLALLGFAFAWVVKGQLIYPD